MTTKTTKKKTAKSKAPQGALRGTRGPHGTTARAKAVPTPAEPVERDRTELILLAFLAECRRAAADPAKHKISRGRLDMLSRPAAPAGWEGQLADSPGFKGSLKILLSRGLIETHEVEWGVLVSLTPSGLEEANRLAK